MYSSGKRRWIGFKICKKQDKDICLTAVNTNECAIKYIKDWSIFNNNNSVYGVIINIDGNLNLMKDYNVEYYIKSKEGKILINYKNKNYIADIKPINGTTLEDAKKEYKDLF